ncbi:MAG: substrate-binding domain-containing protein [Spirochaetaceae bacterium]|jgi:ribose transport system substrate-binding protein|nr:substrate-binding domain-containing protein [Spirochaetaceae bacterium]
MKKILLVVCMAALALSACQGKKDSDKLTIGFNNYSKGIYSLDILEKGFLATCEALGVESMVVNDEGKVENSSVNVDNMISAGVDGIVFFGIYDTMFPVIAQKCNEAGVPFVFFDHMPADDVLTDLAENFEEYKGIAATVDNDTGKNLGSYAAGKGLKKALIITAPRSDTSHVARTAGFTDAFQAGGGQVLMVSYGEVDLPSVMTRANDALTAHPDVDCIYVTNGDAGAALVETLDKHPEVNAELYVTDLDPGVLSGLASGKVAAANGAHWVNVDFATALLVNALRGNEIFDGDRPPRLVVPVMVLPANMVDMYQRFWIDQQPFSADEMRSWVGPDVTVDVFKNELANYNITSRLEAKVRAGLLTQADLDAALANSN